MQEVWTAATLLHPTAITQPARSSVMKAMSPVDISRYVVTTPANGQPVSQHAKVKCTESCFKVQPQLKYVYPYIPAVKGDLLCFLQCVIFYDLCCKMWKSPLSLPIGAPLSHEKSVRNTSLVVPPLILWLHDITVHPNVTHKGATGMICDANTVVWRPIWVK